MTEKEYEDASTFWTRRDQKENKLDPDELLNWIESFLSSHKVLALASGGESFIRCTPLEYSWHHGALWIFSEGGLKFKGLKENKHVAAAIFDPDPSFSGLKSMQIAGTAEIVNPDSDEYKAAAAFKNIPLETLEKLPETMWLIKIIPSEFTCLDSDFKKKGFGSRQIFEA